MGDIPLLASHLAAQCARRLGKRISGIEQSAVDLLVSYRWPGNIRELQNVIERAVILSSEGVITVDTIRVDHADAPTTAPGVAPLPPEEMLPVAPAARRRSRTPRRKPSSGHSAGQKGGSADPEARQRCWT